MSTSLAVAASTEWERDPIAALDMGLANRRAIITALLGEPIDAAPQTDRIFAVAGAKYRHLLNALKPSDKLIDPFSVVDCVLQAAQLGLEAGSDQAYLVPYGGKVSLIVSPRGLIDLAYRHPMVRDINAAVVRAGDFFEYELGDEPRIRHRKNEKPASRLGDLTHVYAVMTLVNGGKVRAVLTAAEVAFYRAFSKAPTGPWHDNPGGMWEKTALKRMMSRGPRSAQMAQAMVENDHGAYVPPGSDEPQQLPPRTVDLRPRAAPQTLSAGVIHVDASASFASASSSALLDLLDLGRETDQAPAAEQAFADRVAVLFGAADAATFEDLTEIAKAANIGSDSPARVTMLRARAASNARLGAR